MLPAPLQKQMGPEASGQVVLKKGYGKFIIIYPLNVWEKELDKILQINQYNSKGAELRRRFLMGASLPQTLDSANRFLVSKPMLEYAGLKKELVIFGNIDTMEIWDAGAFEEYYNNPMADEADLAHELLGQNVKKNEND